MEDNPKEAQADIVPASARYWYNASLNAEKLEDREFCAREAYKHIVGELAATHALLATAEAEAAGLREKLNLFLPQLVQKPFVPSDEMQRPDFVQGVNVAIDMHNAIIRSTINLLGLEIVAPSDCPGCLTPCTGRKEGEDNG